MLKRVTQFLMACLIGFAGMTQIARAADPVTVSPTSVNVNAAGSTTVTLRWRVGVLSSTPRSITVSSPSATLSTGGTLAGSLSRTIRHPGTGLIFVTFNERLIVNRTTAARIPAGGASVSRFFSDVTGTSRAVTVALRTTSGGGLATRNIDLTFDDDTRYRVVRLNTALSARLNLTTNGRGILDGAWEVSGPSAITGSGFRPVARVRKFISGSRRTILESPDLPTNRPGIYRVRFVPNSGVPRGERETIPTLTYSVQPKAAPHSGLGLVAPSAGTQMTSATEFRWRAIVGAHRYRLEFLRADTGGVRAQRIAAQDTESPSARLKGFTFARLTGQPELYWRVIAYDQNGDVIALSSARRISTTTGQSPTQP